MNFSFTSIAHALTSGRLAAAVHIPRGTGDRLHDTDVTAFAAAVYYRNIIIIVIFLNSQDDF